jgi:hypothetical membrane protein
MRNRLLALCGILAPLVYIGTVILGGFLRPEYSHISQAVSDLIATRAPNKSLLDPLFAIYNLLSIAFAVGLLQFVRSDYQHPRKLVGEIGAVVLIAQGIFGLVTLLFPEPAGGMSAAMTSTGKLHIVFAGLSSLTTMLSILLMGFWFKKNQRHRRFASYSFLSVAAVFVTGGLAAMSVAHQSPFAGLAERITIGGFMQWLFVIALTLFV